jgi:copper(I)-binding protein
MIRQLLILFAMLAAVSGCESGDGPPVVAANIVVTAPAAGMPMAAGYLDETIVEDDVARMREIPVLEIEDGETVVFEPGGKHLMLMRPIGTPDTITLNFYSDELLLLSVSAEFTAAMD